MALRRKWPLRDWGVIPVGVRVAMQGKHVRRQRFHLLTDSNFALTCHDRHQITTVGFSSSVEQPALNPWQRTLSFCLTCLLASLMQRGVVRHGRDMILPALLLVAHAGLFVDGRSHQKRSLFLVVVSGSQKRVNRLRTAVSKLDIYH